MKVFSAVDGSYLETELLPSRVGASLNCLARKMAATGTTLGQTTGHVTTGKVHPLRSHHLGID